MTVLYGTLGFHPRKFLRALPEVEEPINRVVIYTGYASEESKKRSLEALGRVRTAIESIGISFDHREFQNPWDFYEILERLMIDLKEEDDNILLNLTGGPKTMTVAAALVSLFLGIRVIYVPEQDNGKVEPFELPLFRIPYSRVLTDKQLKVLKAVMKQKPNSLDELAKILRLKNATITFHIRRLENLGAIELEDDPDNRKLRVPQVTTAGKIMLLAEGEISP